MNTYQFILEEINQVLSNPKLMITDLNQETLQEFKNIPISEIGFTDSKGFGIYLILPILESDPLTQFFNYSPLFIKSLIDYVSILYSEVTNSDPCSFEIQLDTNHAADITNDPNIFYEIQVHVTDQLS